MDFDHVEEELIQAAMQQSIDDMSVPSSSHQCRDQDDDGYVLLVA